MLTLTLSVGRVLDQGSGPTGGRFQKNSNNGEIISYVRNDAEPEMCAVSAAQRIRERAQRLGVLPNEPIAVYGTQGQRTFLNEIEIQEEMRACAKQVYNITSKEDLARYSSHSVRVGACVALHATGASVNDIQFRLHWRSDKFKNYLRHVTHIADTHNLCMDKISLDNI